MRKWAVILMCVLMITVSAVVLRLSAGSVQASAQAVQRGKYLVNGGGCGDCHTPKKMGPSGPEPDTARTLSGHPEMLTMPAPPRLGQGPWMAVVSATFTAWAGPWGISFTSNLTPDKETGLGKWSIQTFVDTIRSGRVMGRGRPLLPPMPYPDLGNLTDEDLQAIAAYLASIPAVANRVPDPIPPADAGPR